MRLAACMTVAHQARPLQDTEMLGDGWLRNPGLAGQCRDGLLTFAAQSLEDGPAGCIGEGSEEHIVGVRHRDI
jgi:hypothetical protein